MKYDLHIHSCLSPCGDDDMTPANISGMAYLAGLNVIAVSDHNSAKNIQAVTECALNYGVKVLPAIEVCTAEEIHVLCYFSDLNKCLNFAEKIEAVLPKIKNKTEIYGNQYIMNGEDEIISQYENLLIVGCGYTVYELVQLCHEMSGLCFYAHIDKNSYSVLSVLGALPADIEIDGVEIYDLNNRQGLIDSGYICESTPYMSNSDAHTLDQIGIKELEMQSDNPLTELINLL